MRILFAIVIMLAGIWPAFAEPISAGIATALIAAGAEAGTAAIAGAAGGAIVMIGAKGRRK